MKRDLCDERRLWIVVVCCFYKHMSVVQLLHYVSGNQSSYLEIVLFIFFVVVYVLIR